MQNKPRMPKAQGLKPNLKEIKFMTCHLDLQQRRE